MAQVKLPQTCSTHYEPTVVPRELGDAGLTQQEWDLVAGKYNKAMKTAFMIGGCLTGLFAVIVTAVILATNAHNMWYMMGGVSMFFNLPMWILQTRATAEVNAEILSKKGMLMQDKCCGQVVTLPDSASAQTVGVTVVGAP